MLKIVSVNQYVPAKGPSIEKGYNTEHYNGLVLLFKFVQPRDSQVLNQDSRYHRSRVPRTRKRDGLTKTLRSLLKAKVRIIWWRVNPLLNGKILNYCKSKGQESDKLLFTQFMESVFENAGNTLIKGENAGYLFSQFFSFRAFCHRAWAKRLWGRNMRRNNLHFLLYFINNFCFFFSHVFYKTYVMFLQQVICKTLILIRILICLRFFIL